ncbi:MAG: glycosyltransferase family 39 protein [Chloroflexi bacterium]|nr:glycosyltransferase family 39 protein [Chloroflexota bacterium]
MLGIQYARLTPIWQNPDEPAHFTYIEQIARAATLPVLEPGDWDSDLLQRLKTGQMQPGDSIERIRYEGWQPPLYYLAAAPVLRLALDRPIEQQVQALRGFDLVLGAITVGLAYAAGRRIFGGGQGVLALAVALCVVGVPMFTAVSAAITDDALANLLGALLAFLLLGWCARPASWASVVAVGVLLGVAVLTKLLLALFAPVALGVLLWNQRHTVGSGLRKGGVLALAALATISPWLVRQGLTYGWLDLLATRRHELVAGDQPRFPGWSWPYVSQWATTVFHSAWGQFGWMAIPMPDRLYWVWGAFTIGAAVGVVAWLVRRAPRALTVGVLLCGALAALAWLVLVGYNLTYEQAQGRYLFCVLVPICVLLVLGWSALSPRVLRACLPLALALALVALNAFVLARILPPAFG